MHRLESMSLHVFISHFVHDEPRFFQRVSDFLVPRVSVAYLRSWARLLKHGTRGNQPWKRDVMTKPRNRASDLRDEHLAQVIRQLEMITSKETLLYIYTNKEFVFEPASNRIKIQVKVFDKWRRMNSMNNSPWEESEDTPWNLVWMHKKDLIDLEAESSDSSRLFIVLENDTSVTEENLRAWLANRERLKPIGLLPSFMRIEYSKTRGMWICIDIHDKRSLDPKKCNRLERESCLYTQIPGLYSGIIVLDEELLSEYVNSDAVSLSGSKKLIWWDMGARSSAGLQFVNVPNGFADRHVLELDKSSHSISVSSTIHHLPNLYVSVPEVSSAMPSLSELSELLEFRTR